MSKPKGLYVGKDGVLYETTPCETRDCDGCAFHRYGVSEDCGLSQGTVNCVSADIIWVKKEVEMSTEPVKEFIKDESVTKPGVKHDQEKERYDLVPVLALEEVAKVLTAGAMKYDDENWRKVPNATRRYFSAAQRHLAWVRKGQTHDQETKLHHYAHAITNLMFLLEKELEITKD